MVLKIGPIDNFYRLKLYGYGIIQTFAMCYNIYNRISQLTSYGVASLQSTRKLKQISGQTILSGLQDPNFSKNREFAWLK